MIAPILVFDSGVGGLSIYDAIRKQIPDAPLVFACDNQGFPYGPKSEADLLARVDRVLTALIAKLSPSLVVVACNTASTVALAHLRSRFTVPFVGVVPAIKPAAMHSKNRVIGLLATPGTVARSYTDKLINDFAADCTVIKVGSSELVLYAEQKLRGQTLSTALIQPLLERFTAHEPKPDTIILACTHFPLLREELSQALGYEVSWLDSGDAIARRVASLLPTLPSSSDAVQNPALHSAWLTAETDEARALLPTFAKRGIHQLRFVRV